MAGECIIEKGFQFFGIPFCFLGKVFHSERSKESHFLNVVFLVIPVKTGTHFHWVWIPAYAGITTNNIQ